MGGGGGESTEVLSWLKTLPVAPEYHPTIQEFQDPISYIFKIEKEASKYGICKIVPPVPPLSRKSVISNFNKSLSSFSSSSQSPPTFTTRQQQLGFCPRKHRPVQKSVWQSGHNYTLQEFEAKAKAFERGFFKNASKKAPSASASLSDLDVEGLFWKASVDRPVVVEYANDMPGSAFGPVKAAGVGAVNVGDTAWNMRGVARSTGSLLRFMKEDIPGVTSPMVYVAMMFSWFAWHVEDHDLHSLNYMHIGAGKTWYGVPRDAATAFEEVVRVHGFREEINPLVTFAMLGEKTTVMSPEVLIRAGVPCCRLVQNAGDFVVTFPRAYHSGFSHGFNCGEASNIATPEWLMFAKDAAIRRASVNYPPMVSHFQLLYDLALALTSSNPSCANNIPRSSRLKDKKRGEGDNLVKELFVQDLMQNNNLLHKLRKGSAVVLLPQNSSERFICSNMHTRSRYQLKSSMVSSSKEVVKTSECLDSNDIQAKSHGEKRFKTYSRKAKFSSTEKGTEVSTCSGSNVQSKREESALTIGLSDRGLFSCVKCGIWPFACVAIVQPTESTSRYLMSTDFNLDDVLELGELHNGSVAADACHLEANCGSGWTPQNAPSFLNDIVDQPADQIETVDYSTNSIQSSSDHEVEKVDEISKMDSDAEMMRSSALGLLALTYGNSSDSDEDDIPPYSVLQVNGGASRIGSWESKCRSHHSASPLAHQEHNSGATGNSGVATLTCEGEAIAPHSRSISHSCKDREFSRVDSDDSDFGSSELAEGFSNNSMMNKHSKRPSVHDAEFAEISNPDLGFTQRPDDDSSRMHVFCLEHALELEQLLRPFGGIHVMLLCHSDYPKVEDAAKLVAEELEMDSYWNDSQFRVAAREDEARIQLALQSEEETPKSSDWAVKLGINLYYSSILCRSPLYSKQMPYNSVIYGAFGCSTPSASPKEPKIRGMRSNRQKKIVMAGKWCGKVWMSNQVHPFLVKHSELEGQTFGDRLEAAEKIVEKRKTVCKSATSFVLRTAMKRKLKSEDSSIKRKKSQERKVAENESDSLVDVESREEHKKNIKVPLMGRRTIRKARFPATEVADSDSEDSADVGLHQEQEDTTVNRPTSSTRSIKNARSPEMEFEESGPEDPVEDSEHRQGPRRSVRSQRFKGRNNSRSTFGRQVADDPCEADSNTGMKIAPSSCTKKRPSKLDKDLETGVSDLVTELKSRPRSRMRQTPSKLDLDLETGASDSNTEMNSGPRSQRMRKRPSKLDEDLETGASDSVTEMKSGPRSRRTRKRPSKLDEDLETGASDSDTEMKSGPRSRRTRKRPSKLDDDLETGASDSDTEVKCAPGSRMRKRPSKLEDLETGASDSDTEMKSKPRSRMRKRSSKLDEDLENGASAKRAAQKSNGKKTVGPRMRLPTVKSTTSKGPKMRFPVDDTAVKVPASRSSTRKALENKAATNLKAKAKEEGEYFCDIEGCRMSFKSEEELSLHQRNICPVDDCFKKFFSHKYLVQHRRVHEDDRPLKCPWKGCKMTFKWAWARTEHIRVHTGARPYICKEPGCAQTFRFVSDFSRHKRKTGHLVRKKEA